MRKVLLILLAAAMVVLLVSACGAKTETEETLILYTSMKESLITALTDDFMEKHPGIKVETQIDGAGSIMRQIEFERGSGSVKADVIWTSEIPDFYYMKSEGLLLQYAPADADKIYNTLEDNGSQFFPARLGTLGIAYNTNLITSPPEAWSDLFGADFKDGFAIADPTTSGTALMSVVLLTEAFGEQFFRDLKANGAVIGQGSSAVVEAVANGELAACLAVDYITFDKIKSGAPIAMAYPDEMLVISSPIAIFEESPNVGAAKKFADYIFTADAQQIIASIGTLPARDGVAVSGEFNIPPVAEAMGRAIQVNDIDVLLKKDGIISAFLEIMSMSLPPFDTSVSGEVIILHTNDMHGRIFGDSADDEYGSVLGMDRITALHKNTPSSILLDAGDTLHGLPAATLSRGEDVVLLMNDVGYDAMTAGNHDFNYGWQRLIELRDIANFSILASNVLRNGSPFLDDTTMLDVNGIQIGVFGLTTESSMGSVMPDFISGLEFEDAIEIAKVKTEYLRSMGAHIVIALCHLGVEPLREGTLSTELAQAVPGIDVIIDGHSHSELENGIVENGVLIAQTGDHGGSVGKVTVTVENGLIASKTASLIGFQELANLETDAVVASRLFEITLRQEAILGEEIGESSDDMSSERAPGVRTQEMPLGSLVADAYREASEAEIAIANGGDIRADLVTGIITKGDVVSILPFGNTLMVKTVTPALLKEILENGVSAITLDSNGEIDNDLSPAGRFLQISGFSFTYDASAPAGERVLSITLDDGRELDLGDTATQITLAGSNYVMTGGDYYDMLADLPVDRELGSADEALSAYIAKHSPVTAPGLGRITVVGATALGRP